MLPETPRNEIMFRARSSLEHERGQLDPGEPIREPPEEGDQSFVLSAEMERTQRHGNVHTLVGLTLVLHRVDDHDRVQERRPRHPHSWTQVTELLLSRAVQLPSVHASDAEPGPDLFPGHPLLSRRRPFAAISIDAGQELPLTLRIAPGVCLEPPATYRLY